MLMMILIIVIVVMNIYLMIMKKNLVDIYEDYVDVDDVHDESDNGDDEYKTDVSDEVKDKDQADIVDITCSPVARLWLGQSEDPVQQSWIHRQRAS